MNNLGGHDLPSMLDAFHATRQTTSRPASSLHRQGLRPADGRPQGQPRRPDDAGADGNVPQGQRRARRATSGTSSKACRCRPTRSQDFLDSVPFARRRPSASSRRRPSRCRTNLPSPMQPMMSTQTGFGAILNEIGRGDERIRAAASSPRRPTSRSRPISGRGSTGADCSRARRMADTFKSERIPSTFNWEFSPKGQHIELGIAEMNLFILLSALGLSHVDQRRAAAADRHAVRSLHRARPRCAQLRLLPGRPLHGGGDAVRHHAAPAKAARTSRSPSR